MHRAAWPLSSYDEIWDKRFESLRRFVKKHNRFPVSGETYEEFQLGNWLKTNRVRYYAGKLNPQRTQKLKSINNIFNVVHGRRDSLWMERLELLKKFHKVYGRWPQNHEKYADIPIGQWLYRNRAHYFYKRMPPNRLRELLKAGYVFKPLRKLDSDWEESFEALLLYIERFPERWTGKEHKWPGSPRLRAWCKEMIKRHSIGSLKPEHRKKLEALDFPFTKKVNQRDRFMTQARYLLQYRRFYPNRKVDSFTEYPRGNRLGRWCIYIRSRGKEALTRDQIKLLEKVGFDWGNDDIQWRKKFDSVVKFYRQYSRIPRATYNTPKREQSLGCWLKYQKKKILTKKLTYDKYVLLKPYIKGVEYTGYSAKP